jgi:RNA polymerase sigma factor (TIGR02999 family)
MQPVTLPPHRTAPNRLTGHVHAALEASLNPHEATRGTVTRLLVDLERGDAAALDELFPPVYEELRMLAHRHRRRWHGDDTLGTTALVHEAYVKLVDQKRIHANGRAHFLALAARAMRHILSNYARARRRQKRGGGRPLLSLDALQIAADPLTSLDDHVATITVLSAALEELDRFDERLARVVECRFFAGLSIPDTAIALGTSPATVKRDWALARAWLFRQMNQHAAAEA